MMRVTCALTGPLSVTTTFCKLAFSLKPPAHVHYGIIKLLSIWIISPLWLTTCSTKVQQP